MLTISRLAKRFGLSRSTLVNYDLMGLLKPSGRSSGNYRLYDERDIARLERIVALREVGLSLEAIGHLMAQNRKDLLVQALEAQLHSLHREIGALRGRQKKIATMLANYGERLEERMMDVDQWVALLRAAGMTEADMCQWHREFELRAPHAHRDFLFSLGLEEEKVIEIRRQSLVKESW
ncbi:MAG: MerR family transcriptional regulator [Magnetococcales bacterium]|nr:MerR family transcriptional regulator [Magnetococcales bacterium]MBF0148865.1 MerR family transcriptional regulator [Magnetococcales bacterium]MBF0173135.1 MerR family transcriptional regulator [Magnetococcales bacterium]